MHKDTVDYYCQHAEAFIRDTLTVDMSSLYRHFLPLLPPNAHILDAGCGSGRDSSAFEKLGYQVCACDASPELAALAKQHLGVEVEVKELQSINWQDRFDAIWACASLLHIPRPELPYVLRRFHQALKADGVIYLSFKYGEGERQQGGRYFNDMTEAGLARCLVDLTAGSGAPLFSMVECWTTADKRPGREQERWLNALIRKQGV